MTRLMCRLCGYKYSPRSENIPVRCPHCGKFESLEHEPSANQILHEVNNLFDH